ncbi:MAG: Hint domain-containing protein [Paracoccaceae bacterium]
MAFISEVHYVGTGVASHGEYVEIALRNTDNPGDYVVSVYRHDGTLHMGAGISGGEVNLSTLTGVPDPDHPNWTIYTIPVGIKDNNTSDDDEGSAIALTNVNTTTVIDFFGTNNFTITATEGAANGATSDAVLDWVATGLGNSYKQDVFGNTSTGPITNDDAVVCISGGSMVRCKDGDLRADALQVDDLVWTLDHGYQPVRWIGHAVVDERGLYASPSKYPVRIKAGALNATTPARDMLVSPQHRILLRSKICERMYDSVEVLVAAKKLCDFDGIAIADDVANITYFHIAFDKHEVFEADGALVESLFLGKEALKILGDGVNEMEWLKDNSTGLIPVNAHPARPIATRKKLASLLERHTKNAVELLEATPAAEAKNAATA